MVTDAAAPALQRIERAAIAASTQITYPPHELLRLIQVSCHVLSGARATARASGTGSTCSGWDHVRYMSQCLTLKSTLGMAAHGQWDVTVLDFNPNNVGV